MIPFLVRELVEPDSFHAKVHTWVYDHVPSVFHKVLPQPLYANQRKLASRLLHGNFYALPYLAPVLPRASSMTRSLALEALRVYSGTNCAPYIPEITACLSDSSTMVRGSALSILTAIGPSASNAVPQLLQMLAQTNGPVDPAAGYAVWKIAHRTNESLPVLHAEFKKLTARNQLRLGNYSVTDWLLEMEPNSPPVIEYYRAWLQETNARSRIKACQQIANRRGNASALLPDVWKLMDDPDPKVKQAALHAVSAVEPRAKD